jgi:hypothetical protein
MSKRKLTDEQISELLKNENVARCSAKSISYSKSFMIAAVHKYNEGSCATQIFKEAGFDLSVIGKHGPDDRLHCWRKIYKTKGADRLRIETRGKHHGGGRPRTIDLTDADKIKRMSIEIAYLKAENDFLAKLRAAKKR